MRIVVGSALKASSQWAHAINTVKMAEGFARLGHDVTVICQAPAIAPHREAMRRALAAALGVTDQQISIKATSSEGLGAVGRGAGILAQAVALLFEAPEDPDPSPLDGYAGPPGAPAEAPITSRRVSTTCREPGDLLCHAGPSKCDAHAPEVDPWYVGGLRLCLSPWSGRAVLTPAPLSRSSSGQTR